MLLVKRLLNFLLKSTLTLILLLFIGIGIQYLSTTIFEFSEQKPFSGNHWHNPYEEKDSIEIRANFHAHSCVWGDATYGDNTSCEMVSAYKKRGYDLCPMSNYFMLDTNGKAENSLFVPAYEHGLNIFKKHCIAINPDKVSFHDYFLFQWPSHQQKVINSIRDNRGIVALAHPELSHGRSPEDLAYLNNYQLVEVLNHYRVSDEHWDAALSAGRLVYILANDDSHQIDTTVMFRMWNVILPKKRTKESVLQALSNGQSYGVHTDYCQQQNKLISCHISNDSLIVSLSNKADEIKFIGQGGKIMATTSQDSIGTYVLKDSDSYIRVLAKNSESALYLNPVTRYDDQVIYNRDVQPKEKTLQTWLFRAFILIIEFCLLLLIYRIWKRKKRK